MSRFSRIPDRPRLVDGDGDGIAVVDIGAFEFDACPADLDGDGAVGTADLLELLGNWGACG